MHLGSRIAVLAACLALALCAFAQPAFAISAAQIAFVERRGLLETDARCHLIEPPVRLAMQVSLNQSRGALLRGGWTTARIAELESAAMSAARRRACDDPRSAEAAERARQGFQAWTRTPSMTFQGGERAWVARRSADPDGWRLRQDAPAPAPAAFGVREAIGQQHLSFVAPLPHGAAPAAAQLIMRDPARADTRLLDVPGRNARGLAAGLPSPQSSQRFWAMDRRIESPEGAARRIVFTFPNAAFSALSDLDPRETVEVRLGAENASPRILFEVGDLVAARGFLALGAAR